MKNKKKIISLILSGVIIVGLVINVLASQAGSSEDPIVSKSYVDTMMDNLLDTINSSITNGTNTSVLTNAQMESILSDVIARLEFAENTDISLSKESPIFKPVEVKAGKKLIGKEGTEIILRTGKSVIYSESQDGVTNTTTGKDLLNGATIEANNYLIIPRDDGRGAVCLTDCWYLVKGSYEIK